LTAYNLAAGERGAYAKTLTAATVDTVTFLQDVGSVEVYGDGTSAIYFTIDGTVPTVAGGAMYELPAGGPSVRTITASGGTAPVVKLISSGTPKYSVSGE
jgi:hypothetical protein